MNWPSSLHEMLEEKTRLQDVTTVAERIEKGEPLMVAGDESLLAQLPKGNWLGGTVPYFMADSGVVARKQLFASEISGSVASARTQVYGADSLERIVADAPENGYTLLIVPFGSRAHERFAREAPRTRRRS